MFEYKVNNVNRIIDGDTLELVIDLGFGIYRVEKVRLNRVDTPETSSKNSEEKILGIEAKTYVENWVQNQKSIKIKTFKDDKYGRILADIYGTNGECLNDLLIKNGFAWEYDGTEKIKNFELLLERRKNNDH
jgi:micrococcal nuclease